MYHKVGRLYMFDDVDIIFLEKILTNHQTGSETQNYYYYKHLIENYLFKCK